MRFQVRIEMDVDSSISTGWVFDRNFESVIQLQSGQRHLSFCRDPQILRMKENEKLFGRIESRSRRNSTNRS